MRVFDVAGRSFYFRVFFMSELGARHLLIKFEGSRNPVSRRTGASTSGVTAAQAEQELQSYADKVRPRVFAACPLALVAATFSDHRCPAQ